jgi:hypothetical protein
VLTPDEATALLCDQMHPLHEKQEQRLETLDHYHRGQFELAWMPPKARREYRRILDRARMNYLKLVVKTIRQRLYVDGFRIEGEPDADAVAWRIWQANSMDSRQAMIHSDALVFSVAYATVWPDPVIGARIAGESPLAMTVLPQLDDPTVVQYALKRAEIGGKDLAVLYDEEAAYRFVKDENGSDKWVPDGDPIEHFLGVTPVVPYLNDPDNLGRTTSEIEALLPIQDRINETIADRLMAQKYAPVEPFNAAVDRMWISEDPDAKFGEFDVTPLDPYLAAVDSDVRHMAAIAQVPAAYLLGSIDNVSADALVAAEAGLMSLIEDKQGTFGEAHEAVMRLALQAAGSPGAQDLSSEVIWRNTETRSPAVLIDGLVKLKSLGLPMEFILERLGLSPQERDRVLSMTAAEPAPAPIDAMPMDPQSPAPDMGAVQ